MGDIAEERSIGPTAVPQQILTFSVEQRLLGVDVANVREIKGWQAPTPLPQAPEHVLGVINLRGQLIALLDLRRRLALPPRGGDCGNLVVVVVDTGAGLCGLVADAVCDIRNVTPGDLRASPMQRSATDLVRDLAVQGDEVIALLNISTFRDAAAVETMPLAS